MLKWLRSGVGQGGRLCMRCVTGAVGGAEAIGELGIASAPAGESGERPLPVREKMLSRC